MGVTTSVNNRTVIHKDSGGVTPAFPDVCKTPTPGGPVPIPYPNVAKSSDTAKGAKTVKVDGNPVCVKDSNFATSTGDEAGNAGGGVASIKFKGKAEFISWSMDVTIEGKQVPRAFDMMLHNDKNTPPAPVMQGPALVLPPNEKPICVICDKCL